MSKYRRTAKKVISQVIKDNPGIETGKLEKLIRAAYPFEERRHDPYRIWREEVNKTMIDLRTVGDVRTFWANTTQGPPKLVDREW